MTLADERNSAEQGAHLWVARTLIQIDVPYRSN
jgi:hypothetical protein